MFEFVSILFLNNLKEVEVKLINIFSILSIIFSVSELNDESLITFISLLKLIDINLQA